MKASSDAIVGLWKRILERVDQVGLWKFIASTASRLGSTLLSFLVLFALSQTISPDEYGLFVFLFSVGMAVGLIATLGQPMLLIKHLVQDGPESNARRELLLFSLVWLAGGIAACMAAGGFVAVADDLPPPYVSLPVALVFAGVFAVSETLMGYFRACGRISMALVPRENAWRAGSLAVIATVLLVEAWQSAVMVLLLMTLLLVATTVYQAVAFLSAEGSLLLRARGRRTGKRGQYSRESIYFTINSIIDAGDSYLSTVLIGIVLGLDAAAVYFIALRLALLLNLTVVIVDTVGVPAISRYLQADDRGGAQSVIGLCSFICFSVTFFGFIFILVIGDDLLAMFNPMFADETATLYILSAGMLIPAFVGPGSRFMMITGGERAFLGLRILLFPVYVLMLVAFVSALGILGAALAHTTFLAVTNAFQIYWSARYPGFDITAYSFFRPVFFRGGSIATEKG